MLTVRAAPLTPEMQAIAAKARSATERARLRALADKAEREAEWAAKCDDARWCGGVWDTDWMVPDAQEGSDIADRHATLIAIAKSEGLDPAVIGEMLEEAFDATSPTDATRFGYYDQRAALVERAA